MVMHCVYFQIALSTILWCNVILLVSKTFIFLKDAQYVEYIA